MRIISRQAVLMMVAGLLVAAASSGQVYSLLYSFPYGVDNTGPAAGLVLSGNTLYGTVPGTVPYSASVLDTNSGYIYKINTDGTCFSNIYSFTTLSSNSLGVGTNVDGANPRAGLILSGNVIYGTACTGGTEGNGTVFRLNTDGTDFTNLYSFSATNYNVSNGTYTNGDGASPMAPLLLSGNTLFGTTIRGGPGDGGTVFRVNTDGTCFTNLSANFSMVPSPVILSSNRLYWAAFIGCCAVNIDGSSFTNLHSFLGENESEGFAPQAGLTLLGNRLYGTASQGGAGGHGTIFRLNTDGTDFTNLYQFMGASDGGHPETGLLFCGDKIYGGDLTGGPQGNGVIFQMNLDGSGFTNLYSNAALNSFSSFVLSGNTLYGTTSGYAGLVFALSLGPIPLNAQMEGGTLLLNWGNPAFSLQASTNLYGTFTNVAGASSPYTNTLGGSQLFFRLEAD